MWKVKESSSGITQTAKPGARITRESEATGRMCFECYVISVGFKSELNVKWIRQIVL